MAHIRVTTSFDYRWPSGSLTAFEAGPDILTTRRECVDYAVEKGYGVDPDAVKGKVTGGEVKSTATVLVGKSTTESFVPAVKPDKA